MSIEDRDWIREPRPARWSFRGLPPVLTILSVTTFAFLVQSAVTNGSYAGEIWIQEHLALSLDGVRGGEAWQPLTYLLLHKGFGHLFWNMVALWVFGRILSDLAADRVVWLNYVLGGVAGAGACFLWEAAVPAARGSIVVGASGAVTGILAAAVLRAPRAPIPFPLLPVPIPLWVIGAVYLALDLVGAIRAWAGGEMGAVAFQAHLGGAAGAAVLFLFARRSAPAPRRVRREVVGENERLASVPPPPPESPERRDEARVDALLAKIHAWGMGSLSDEEKEFLKKASERYRGRRK